MMSSVSFLFLSKPVRFQVSKILAFLLSLISTCCFTYGQIHSGTYTQGKTTYYSSETYKTTGQPLVKRSEAAKSEFLKRLKIPRLPLGFQIDHIKPLSQGGEDIPENMQLLTIGQHKFKTALERGEVAKINHDEITYTSFYESDETPIGIRTALDWENQKNISPKDIDRELNSRRVLYEGPRGGKYYVNSVGTKTYIKSTEETETIVPSDVKPRRLAQNSDLKETISETPRQYFTGQKGGIYYLSKTGNKIYVKRTVDAEIVDTSVLPATTTSGTAKGLSSGTQTREIITGPRGGQYYYNSNGNKTYIKK